MWSEGGFPHPFLDPSQSQHGQAADAARQAANAAAVMGVDQVNQHLHEAARQGAQAELETAAFLEGQAMWWIQQQQQRALLAAGTPPPAAEATNPVLRAAEAVEQRVTSARSAAVAGGAATPLPRAQPKRAPATESTPIAPPPRRPDPAPQPMAAGRSSDPAAAVGKAIKTAVLGLTFFIILLGMLPACLAVLACAMSPATAIPDAWPWLTLYVGSFFVFRALAD